MESRRRNGNAMDLLENDYVSNIVEIATRYFIACQIAAGLI